MSKEITTPEHLTKTPDHESERETAPAKEVPIEHPQEQPAVSTQPTVTPAIPDEVGAVDHLTPEQEKEKQEIEDILEEDLGDLYMELDPETQKTFKESGEQTISTVMALLHKTKVHTKSIIRAISKWLRIIPGVNKYFVEQEAKLKTDKIIEVHDELHHHD